ncbi:MAG: hypothetical protein QF837_03995, partial [Acidimicrobiales bacterium]|nr:hypothetical protein [Acidimicrobiales bacterium]
ATVVVTGATVVVTGATVVVTGATVVVGVTSSEEPPQEAIKKNKQATTHNFFIHTSVPYTHRITVCRVFLEDNQDYIGVGGGT